ncbi:MAG: hypothetical protein AAGA56_22450 [Myxococcota bacterium]
MWRRLLIFALTTSGCAAGAGPNLPSEVAAEENDDEPRRPDGVAIDRVSPPPSSRSTGAVVDAVLSLRTPLGMDAARTTIERFFQAVLEEDRASLSAIMSPNARAYDLNRGGRGRYQGANALWSTRFRKHEFSELAQRVVYRWTEVYTYRRGHALPPELTSLDQRLASPESLVLQIPIHSRTNSLGERLLGPAIFFWLERKGDRYQLVQFAEKVPL